MGNKIKMGYLKHIQSFETSIETGNLQSYDKQSIGPGFYLPTQSSLMSVTSILSE